MNTQTEIPSQAHPAQNGFTEAMTLPQPNSQVQFHTIEPSFPARKVFPALTQEQVLQVLVRAQRDLAIITGMTGTWSAPGAGKIYATAERCLGMLMGAAERLCPDAMREQERQQEAAKAQSLHSMES